VDLQWNFTHSSKLTIFMNKKTFLTETFYKFTHLTFHLKYPFFLFSWFIYFFVLFFYLFFLFFSFNISPTPNINNHKLSDLSYSPAGRHSTRLGHWVASSPSFNSIKSASKRFIIYSYNINLVIFILGHTI
jgi:hypothetical protein